MVTLARRVRPKCECIRVVHANVDHIVGQLQASQPMLAELIRAGKVKVVGGYYDLKTGAVTFTR